nr:hypothetical protein [Nostoc flagelliforme]
MRGAEFGTLLAHVAKCVADRDRNAHAKSVENCSYQVTSCIVTSAADKQGCTLSQQPPAASLATKINKV